MTTDMWITLLLLAAGSLLFVTEWLRVDVVAFGVVVALMLTGILTVDEALAGFSNSAVLTISALFVAGGATMQTGLAAAIGRRILRIHGNNPVRLTLVLMGAGSYRFRDYLKVGLPMIAVMLMVTVLVVPMIFPF